MNNKRTISVIYLAMTDDVQDIALQQNDLI